MTSKLQFNYDSITIRLHVNTEAFRKRQNHERSWRDCDTINTATGETKPPTSPAIKFLNSTQQQNQKTPPNWFFYDALCWLQTTGGQATIATMKQNNKTWRDRKQGKRKSRHDNQSFLLVYIVDSWRYNYPRLEVTRRRSLPASLTSSHLGANLVRVAAAALCCLNSRRRFIATRRPISDIPNLFFIHDAR